VPNKVQQKKLGVYKTNIAPFCFYERIFFSIQLPFLLNSIVKAGSEQLPKVSRSFCLKRKTRQNETDVSFCLVLNTVPNFSSNRFAVTRS